MHDNLLTATNATRTSLSNLKKKLSKLRIQVDDLGADLEKIDTKFENILSQAEVYKSKLEREMGREVRRLEKELALLRKSTEGVIAPADVSESNLKVATAIGIFDTILRHMCGDAEDFRVASEAFLFPAVYERVVDGIEEAYYLSEVPAAATLVIQRGKEYITWLRAEYDTHITDPETWGESIDYVGDWWRNDALPLLYGARDEQWDIDMPLSLQEILIWRESPADRPLNFPKIFDAYEVYRKHKDQIYANSGLRDFELKLFTFETEETSQSRFGPR
jgi:polyhydroxyalkanoate synthesis regulator phasin